ncbi:hypothetical protein QBC37DRAFT_21140 [Rhypophila decipiens]|uniref:Uncharacterized protein n=1 Tax=Rhypophila decipiens TaxID=261697 RepID=A0AAN6Y1T7_9PEZI|nr:hypothetical protein QBC37DRAFT_21140 [Rhypophila decipiens]
MQRCSKFCLRKGCEIRLRIGCGFRRSEADGYQAQKQRARPEVKRRKVCKMLVVVGFRKLLLWRRGSSTYGPGEECCIPWIELGWKCHVMTGVVTGRALLRSGVDSRHRFGGVECLRRFGMSSPVHWTEHHQPIDTGGHSSLPGSFILAICVDDTLAILIFRFLFTQAEIANLSFVWNSSFAALCPTHAVQTTDTGLPRPQVRPS